MTKDYLLPREGRIEVARVPSTASTVPLYHLQPAAVTHDNPYYIRVPLVHGLRVWQRMLSSMM